MNQPQASFKNRSKAEDAVCQAFVKLGGLAGVDVNDGTGPTDLDADLIDACYQSNFNDPHFLGGPCCFTYATSQYHVDRIFGVASDVSTRLVTYIARHGNAQKNGAAVEAVAVITQAKAWLTKVVAKLS